MLSSSQIVMATVIAFFRHFFAQQQIGNSQKLQGGQGPVPLKHLYTGDRGVPEGQVHCIMMGTL